MSSEKSIFFIFFLYFYDPATSAIVVLILEDFLKVVVFVCQYDLISFGGVGCLLGCFPYRIVDIATLLFGDYAHW